jgi:curli biogenesis system outer membrane secretion channel CsgG
MLLVCVGCTSSGNKHVLVFSDNEKSAGSRYKIAVLPFKYKYIRQTSMIGNMEVPLHAEEIVPTYIENVLLRSQRFRIVDRGNLPKVLEEQKMSLTGLTASASPTIGMLLGADGIITGEIIEIGTLKQEVNIKGTCIFSMKLIDVKSGEVKFTFSAEETVLFGSYLDALKKASENLFNEINKRQDLN